MLMTLVHHKENKLLIPWDSKIPKKYRRNVIIGGLHRSKQISSDFTRKLRKIIHSILSKIRICIHHVKFTMTDLHVEKNTFKRSKETFLYVMMNIENPLKNENHLHMLKRKTLHIISLG